jgi:hypothetical protein
VLEPAVLGEGEVFDDAADAEIRRRERSCVDVVGGQVSCLGEDGAAFLVESFRETDPFRRWLQVGEVLARGHVAIVAAGLRAAERIDEFRGQLSTNHRGEERQRPSGVWQCSSNGVLTWPCARDVTNRVVVTPLSGHPDGVSVLIAAKDLLHWETQQPPVITPAEFEQRFGAR